MTVNPAPTTASIRTIWAIPKLLQDGNPFGQCVHLPARTFPNSADRTGSGVDPRMHALNGQRQDAVADRNACTAIAAAPSHCQSEGVLS